MSVVEAIATISQEQLSEIDSSLRENGKMQFELGIELKDSQDVLVARATGVYYASRKKPPG
jgi:hypothetical protein